MGIPICLAQEIHHFADIFKETDRSDVAFTQPFEFDGSLAGNFLACKTC